MKNKTKTTKATKVPVLSRLTLKTFLIIAALTVLINGLMSVKFYYDALQMGDSFRFALYTLYPLVTVVGPLLAFGIVYLISKEKTTKLWRVSKAAILATIAAMFQSFVTPISMSAFTGPRFTETPQMGYIYLFEALPVILAVLLAVGLSIVISKSKAANTSDATKLFQKIFLGSVIVFGIGQPIVAVAAGHIGDPMSQPIEALVFDVLAGLVIPVIILSVLYLIVSRRRSVLERSFTTLFYAVIGVALLIALSPIPYLFTSPTQTSFTGGWVAMYLPSVVALVAFTGIVAWHKLRKAI